MFISYNLNKSYFIIKINLTLTKFKPTLLILINHFHIIQLSFAFLNSHSLRLFLTKENSRTVKQQKFFTLEEKTRKFYESKLTKNVRQKKEGCSIENW